MPTAQDLQKAGMLIRERKLTDKKGNEKTEYQVVDGRKIVSRHVMFTDAMQAAFQRLTEEKTP